MLCEEYALSFAHSVLQSMRCAAVKAVDLLDHSLPFLVEIPLIIKHFRNYHHKL